jgi:hypothetical protein
MRELFAFHSAGPVVVTVRSISGSVTRAVPATSALFASPFTPGTHGTPQQRNRDKVCAGPRQPCSPLRRFSPSGRPLSHEHDRLTVI